MSTREASVILVLGRQGVGKTFGLRSDLNKYCIDTPNRKGRRVLVFDVNPKSGSYAGIPSVMYDSRLEEETERCVYVKSWHKDFKQVRRIIAMRPDGLPMSMDEMNRCGLDLMTHFRDGALVFDDFLSWSTGASLQKKFVSNLIRVRHLNTDLFLVAQGVRSMGPAIWTQASLLKLYYCSDDADTIKNKLQDKYEITKIAQIIVGKEYNSGNIRFHLWIDYRKFKIRGATEQQFNDACSKYLKSNPNELRKFRIENDINDVKNLERICIDAKRKYYMP